MDEPKEDSVIQSLCLQQMAPWLGRPIDRKAAEEVYHKLNASVRSIFLFRIQNGAVDLLEKPGFKVRQTFNDSREPEPKGRLIYREELVRAKLYNGLLSHCLSATHLDLNILIAIDVNDAPVVTTKAPVFAFQKPCSGNTILIPDVDFLHSDFYVTSEFHDDTFYTEKSVRAVFAGSTTGGRTITARDVRDLSIPRLRSGVFFRDNDKVDFRIPRIVQCRTERVAEMIAALGINNRTCSWPEQFTNRFILSMDGNGATCSRVVIGLLSQSVLVKYDSPFQLYYFGALLPWRHFIPVSKDTDVIAIVEAERRYPMMFAAIAAHGRQFARRYLGHYGVCTYFACLLALYELCLCDASGSENKASGQLSKLLAAPTPVAEFGAHIAEVGDTWGWPGDWVGQVGGGKAIEAISIIPSGLPHEAIDCRVLMDDDRISSAENNKYFHGTRGLNRPLHGFELQIRDPWADGYNLNYCGSFLDGETIGPLASGEVCRSTTNAPLEAFKIMIEKKPGLQ